VPRRLRIVQDLRIRPETDIEARARAGDPAAFGAFLRLHDRDLRGVAWAVVRSDHATDDIMQSAYEKAFRAIGGFDGRSSLKTWLHAICYRTAIDYTRYEGRRRHDDVEHQTVGQGMRVVPDTAEEVVSRASLDEAFALLDDHERPLLMLTLGLGYSYDEVSAVMDIPRGTVASRVNRARKRITAQMTTKPGNPSPGNPRTGTTEEGQ